MWITNQIIGSLANKKGLKPITGQWLNAELNREEQVGSNELLICTIAEDKECYIDGKNKYLVLDHGNIIHFKVNDDAIHDWKNVIDIEKPDCILIWGTECAVGHAVLLANKLAKKPVPVAVYIQGVMKSIYENYRGGLTDLEIKRISTLLEKIRHTGILDFEKQYYNYYLREKEVLELTDYIIVENKWAESIYRDMNPRIKVLNHRLPIHNVFFQKEWSESKIETHRIITSAAGYPLKGLHQLIKALVLVRDKYPDVSLIVPGLNSFMVHGFKNRISQHGFNRYVRRLIEKNGLKNSVIFSGPLTPEQYAEEMCRSEVFVCASAIENHSSTLREAMSIGIPCVSSAVGGILEFATADVNCLLYQFNDYEKLAEYICRLFNNQELRMKLSYEGRRTISNMYLENKLMSMQEIYKEMVNWRKNYEDCND